MLVLGAGLQGSACAFDLLSHTDATVTLADVNPVQVAGFVKAIGKDRLKLETLDAKDETKVRTLMKGHDAAMSALPYYFNYSMARSAVEVGLHFSDLGGNTEIVRQQQGLDADAAKKNLSVMPDCGLAPGMINILAAEGIRRLDTVNVVRLYVGGLPQDPQPPLNYNIVYSLEGVLDYYTTPSWIVRDGRPTTVEALSEIEQVEFPAPAGTLEAFHTAGGISTMPWEFEGKIPVMEYKTLRFPGHATIIRAIRELGLLGLDPVQVKNQTIVPRDAFIALADPILRKPGVHDFVALRVVVTGTKGGRDRTVTFDLLDLFDAKHGISAMMRTTGYSLSLTGQLQVAGAVVRPGVTTSWEGTPFGPYVAGLRERGVMIQEREGPPTH
ncbi:MAG: saccharopine dehydrogenase C-terminal domain-containing protein [Gemmatimonadales bacterium]